MSNKVRILILLTDAFGADGGIAKFNRDLLTAICRYPGIQEVVAIPRLQPKAIKNLPKNLSYITSGVGSKFKYAFCLLRLITRSKAQTESFAVILCAHIHLMPFAWLAAKRYGIPVYLLIYGIEAWQPRYGGILRFFCRRLKGVITISEVTRGKYQKWLGKKRIPSFILPCCVDMERFHVGPKDKALISRYGLQNKIVMMTLARLVSRKRHKGVDEVLEVLPGLLKTIPELFYLIAGDGKDRKRLEAKALELGVQDHVFFTGYVPEEEKADHFRLADAFVMPGRGEGFGIVYLEAMACGVPVVGSKLDGSREALQDGRLGILVDPTNPAELRAGILEALARSKGVVPPGLEIFSVDRFERSGHTLLDTIISKPTK